MNNIDNTLSAMAVWAFQSARANRRLAKALTNLGNAEDANKALRNARRDMQYALSLLRSLM